MDVREATATDADRIREVATDSLHSLYTEFLGEETVETAIEQWYGEHLVDELEDEYALFLVIERDGEIVAFSQSHLVGQQYGTGQLLWVHVHPDHRGSGLGTRLLVRTRERLLDAGAEQVLGFVLAANEPGNEFYRAHGFERASERDVDIGAKTFVENVYAERELESSEGAIAERDVGGAPVFVSYGEAARGSKSPFYAAYEDDGRTTRFGWFCGNCDSIDNAMDSMGRIECNRCGNRRKPTRWDAAYL